MKRHSAKELIAILTSKLLTTEDPRQAAAIAGELQARIRDYLQQARTELHERRNESGTLRR
jgi:hypothetical protein